MVNKLTWSSLNKDEQDIIIEQYFDGEDAEDIKLDIMETLQKEKEYTVTRATVAEWFDNQDKEFQKELLNGQ